ncbi:amidohydrolase family protein [Sphingomonas sp. FW199]|uniref:amidohydrolase family protein n=1 Tax=Sphingomonas sp. FW199 TaxID=3400217 RepID=UPI003CEBABC7
MERLPFIDAHMHLWDLDRIDYPWLKPPFDDAGPNGSVAAIASTYLPADYRAEGAKWNIVGAVHVEAGANPVQSVNETDWLHEMGDEAGLPTVLVAHAALNHPSLDAMLAVHASRPRIRGIRHIVNWHPDPNRTYTPADLTQDRVWRAGFAQLADHGLSFDFQAYPGQFAGVADLFAANTGVPVIINHAGMGVDGAQEWRTAMALLAQLDHVSVKLSGLGFVWRTPDEGAMRERIVELVELFGTDRVMLASDFPTDRLFGDFDATLARMDAALSHLSDTERRAIFAGNANRIYRMGLEL